MIQLDRVSKYFGEQVLFENLSWQLHAKRRIGLIGPNGAGKTTIFRLLAKKLEPDGGRVIIPKDASVGLLPQEVDELGSGVVLEIAKKGRQDILDLTDRIARLTELVDVEQPKSSDIEKLGKAHTIFEAKGGYELHSDAKRILKGIGFTESELNVNVETLSGGMRVRLLLAQLLLMRPSLLLMDEPTNHLDVPSVEWLEGFLRNYEGTVVVISHDRYFLNRLVTEIAAIDVDGFHITPGGYDAYLVARSERRLMLERQAAQQARKIRETERFIERFRTKATKAKQAQSRIKQLAKIERIETFTDRKGIVFRFPDAGRSGKEVAVCADLSAGFGENLVYDGVNVTVYRQDKIGIVGANGAGKSTLLRLMTNGLLPFSGSVRIGHNVKLNYFAQHQVEALDPELTVLEELQAHATLEAQPRCRSILGAFLFSGDDVNKKISVLSGGERSRVALAKLLLSPSNLLLLDEPTNHLDIESRDVLIDAMKQYPGTIIFVSHDRHFINHVATRVFHVEERTILDYPGDYEYYSFKHAAVKAEADNFAEKETKQEEFNENSKRDNRRREANRREALKSRIGPLRAELKRLEKAVEKLELQLEETKEQLADPALYDGTKVKKLHKLTIMERKVSEQLDEQYQKWEIVAENVEKTENEFDNEWNEQN